MAIFVDGHALANTMYRTLQRDVQLLRRRGIRPTLGIVLVGNHKPSVTYVRKKKEAAESIGVGVVLVHLPAATTTKKIVEKIQRLQKPRYHLSGLIVQLPLPRHIDTLRVLQSIRPERDVDCLTNENFGKLVHGNAELLPPAPWAMMHILEHYRIALRGRHVVIIGAGQLVGRPLMNLLLHTNATVSVLNRATKNLAAFTKTADVIMTGVGRPRLVTGSMVRRGAVVIDAGASFIGETLVGDVDVSSVAKKAKIITPTPGGVGPLTVAKLIANTVFCARRRC